LKKDFAVASTEIPSNLSEKTFKHTSKSSIACELTGGVVELPRRLAFRRCCLGLLEDRLLAHLLTGTKYAIQIERNFACPWSGTLLHNDFAPE